MDDEVWEDDLYKNWVRGAKGLEFLQEGLKDFVDDKAPECRNQQLQNLTQGPIGSLPQCNLCTSKNLLPDHANPKTACSKTKTCIQQNHASCYGNKPNGRRKCPNGICSKLYDNIVLEHRFRDPLWKNTDPTTWCTDQHGWSFAKSFQTTPSSAKSSKETDASGLLSFIINNLSMEKWLACNDIGSDTACNFYKAREIRNSILHSPTLALDELTLNSYLDTFIAVLKDTKNLASYKGSRDAIDKLEKLKSNQISITQTDRRRILKIHEDEMNVVTEKSKTEIEAEKIMSLDEMQDKKEATIKEIEKSRDTSLDVIKASVSDVEGSTEKALNEIDARRKKALSEMEEARLQVDTKQQALVTTQGGASSSRSNEEQGGTDASPSNEASSSIIYARQPVKLPEQARTARQIQLQQDLVEFYRQRHQNLPLSPLIEEDNTPLLKFYVMPEINSVKVQRAFGGGNEIKTPIETLRNVFFEGSSQFKDIYLSADAGLGKTAFSKRLALTWCQAHEPNDNEKELLQKDEIDAVKDFDFLFLIFLRDSSGNCDIIDLINDQIIQDLPLHESPLSKQDIDMVLFEKRCLVVLDGLDEWTHPTSCERKANTIPHRKVYRECTVLTTSRPWKLNYINSSCLRFELVKLDKKSKRVLQERVISQLTNEKDKTKLQDQAEKFSAAVTEHDISNVDSIPLLLMYLLCLWCDGRDLGKSLCELYTKIVELLLLRTVKKYKTLRQDLPQVAELAKSEIPKWFCDKKYCTRYYALLTSLTHLAFQTLLGETKENTLVFDNKMAKACLNKELLKFCLESGILSQSKDRTEQTEHKYKLSFAHKTVQEFFAALYMHSAPDKTTVQNKILSQCHSVKDILELSKVFIFLSGINVDMLSSISRKLIEVINKDEITREYRAMTFVNYIAKYTKPLKELQDMYISCVKENPQNVKLKLFHQDIIIDKDCRQEKCFKYLQQLTVQNKENIRSVSVQMEGIPNNVQEIIDKFELTDLRNVDKIYYGGEFDNGDITPLLHRSVKCLTLRSSKWQDNDFTIKRSTWSAPLSKRFYSLDNLEYIYIHCFEMSHDELEKLVKHLSTRNFMQEITLYQLYCTDHEGSCAGLDLSQHSQLRVLGLDTIPLSELNVSVASLEWCGVGHLSKPGLVSRFLSSLFAASKLQTFQCTSLKSTEDIETWLATLRKLVHMKDVRLFNVSLGNREVLSPQMVDIEYIWLHGVTMTASVFCHLVNQVKKQQQTVTVLVRDCTIKPEVEFKKEKDKIKKSPHFSVAFDYNYRKRYVFEFTTIK